MEKMQYDRPGLPPGTLLAILLGVLPVMLIVASSLTSALWGSVEVSERTQILIGNIIQNIAAFFVPAALIASLSGTKPNDFLRLSTPLSWREPSGIIIVFILGLPLLNQTVYWNQQLSLPGSMSGLESAMREMEDNGAHLTETLLSTSSVWGLISGVAVIGILTGLCEEVYFRGALQNIIHRCGVKPWAAILIAATIFSALHFQFFGFVPRLFLGIFFGYLLWATKSLWAAVLAHAINNSLVVVTNWLTLNGFDCSGFDTLGVRAEGFPLPAFASLILLMLFFTFYRHLFFQHKR